MGKLLVVVTSLVLFWVQTGLADTTGCSPMFRQSKSLTTQQGLQLIASILRPPRQDCWNKDSSAILIGYEWHQVSKELPKNEVLFWINVQGQQQFISADVMCFAAKSLFDKNTSYEDLYQCKASAQLRLEHFGSFILEIAPRLNGKWDTHGFERNYIFNF
ncbi:hypothetical protein ACES2L_05485 [Bdellovibrio bacteriovorus]